eukprot:TRINITY_DN6197_c0_g3_i1.p1 TRINITY_DN6197_c0_g3~~TRINITY_DN6197_c0_g3_i1.p1  ORF type:complete len:156 (-),score=24.74 TRINITY_DN6197_c0_g3_i1:68-502(-)
MADESGFGNAWAVPRLIEVSGCCAKAGFPSLSPRSGMMKRKDGDHLGLNGIYELCPEPHNGAPCWEKRLGASRFNADGEDEGRVIFQSADKTSWVIDTKAHTGRPDDVVAARLITTDSDPTNGSGSWVPLHQLEVRAINHRTYG